MDKPCGRSASIYSDSGAALSFFFPSKQLYLIDPLSVVPENSWIASFLYLISLPNLVGFLQHKVSARYWCMFLLCGPTGVSISSSFLGCSSFRNDFCGAVLHRESYV